MEWRLFVLEKLTFESDVPLDPRFNTISPVASQAADLTLLHFPFPFP